MKILKRFKNDCQREKWSYICHCQTAKDKVYIYLVHKYGDIRVLNHTRKIREILEKAEGNCEFIYKSIKDSLLDDYY